MRSLFTIVPVSICVGFIASCDKDGKEAPKGPALPANASQYSQKVVPAQFVNTKNSLSEVKLALVNQAGDVDGPAKSIGLDGATTPQRAFASLAGGNIVSRSMRSLMLSRQNPPPYGDGFPSNEYPTMPPPMPPQTDDASNGDLGLDMSNCDGFFADIDNQIQDSLKQVQSALKDIKEDEMLSVKGVSKGEKAANEAFRFNLAINERGQKVNGTFSGGANDTSAFVKAAGSFAGKYESSTTAGSRSTSESGEIAGIVDLAILVDGKESLMRFGGGLDLAGTTGPNPFHIRAASFFEVSGGQKPSIVLELQGEAQGKIDPSSADQKVQADIKVAMRQSADKNFSVEFKGAGSMTQPQGKKAQEFSMNFRGDFAVENGKCVVKSISCSPQSTSVCQGLEGWKK